MSDVSHDGAVVVVVLVMLVDVVEVVVVGQGSQSSVPPQPSDMLPQTPSPAHVPGVQQTPKGFDPGGAPLTHFPVQQL